MAIQPQGAEFRYQQLTLAFYAALRRPGVDVDLRRPDAALAGYGSIVVPCRAIVEQALLRNLEDAGATCEFDPRSGSCDVSHRNPDPLPPGPLQAHLPVQVTRVESLPPSLVEQVTWGNRDHPVRHWREAVGTGLKPEAHFDDGEGAIYAHRNRLPEILGLRRRGALTFAFDQDAAPTAGLGDQPGTARGPSRASTRIASRP